MSSSLAVSKFPRTTAATSLRSHSVQGTSRLPRECCLHAISVAAGTIVSRDADTYALNSDNKASRQVPRTGIEPVRLLRVPGF